MRKLCEYLILAAIGGAVYFAIELLWRGYSHWTMFMLGGVLFALIGAINEVLPWEMPLLLQGVIGAALVTIAELAAGLILNVWLGLGIWDYTGLWGNVLGQICPQYALAWVFLSPVAIVLDDVLRWRLFAEEKPRYTII